MASTTLDQEHRPAGAGTVWRRAARWGFWFFFLKGIAWLAAPLVAWQAIG